MNALLLLFAASLPIVGPTRDIASIGTDGVYPYILNWSKRTLQGPGRSRVEVIRLPVTPPIPPTVLAVHYLRTLGSEWVVSTRGYVYRRSLTASSSWQVVRDGGRPLLLENTVRVCSVGKKVLISSTSDVWPKAFVLSDTTTMARRYDSMIAPRMLTASIIIYDRKGNAVELRQDLTTHKIAGWPQSFSSKISKVRGSTAFDVPRVIAKSTSFTFARDARSAYAIGGNRLISNEDVGMRLRGVSDNSAGTGLWLWYVSQAEKEFVLGRWNGRLRQEMPLKGIDHASIAADGAGIVLVSRRGSNQSIDYFGDSSKQLNAVHLGEMTSRPRLRKVTIGNKRVFILTDDLTTQSFVLP